MSQNKNRKLSATNGTFDFKTGPAFAKAYLNTYYNQPVTADETAVWKFLMEDFRTAKPKGRFLEIGCGPTLHHIFPFAPYVDQIDMADYLDENLNEVRLWKDNSPDAHNWNRYSGFTLKLEGGNDSPAEISRLESLARSKINNIFQIDLKKDTPKQFKGKYDSIGCFYCAEEVGISVPEWEKVVARVSDFLAPHGILYMTALMGMDTYEVKDINGEIAEYPCANITPDLIFKTFPSLGFPKEFIRLKASEIEAKDQDCCVTGTLSFSAQKMA